MKKHITIGMDLGDKNHIAVVLDGEGNEIECIELKNSKIALRQFFSGIKEQPWPLKLGPIHLGSVDCSKSWDVGYTWAIHTS